MAKTFTRAEIYERLLPPEIEPEGHENLVAREERILRKHLGEMEVFIEEMETGIRAACGGGPAAERRAVLDYYADLMILAAQMIDHERVIIGNAGLKLAVMAVIRGGDVAWAVNLLDQFEKEAIEAMAALEDDEPQRYEMKMLLAEGAIEAAEIMPPDCPLAQRLYEEASYRMHQVANGDLNGYLTLILNHASSCFEPDIYPGAIPVFEMSYDNHILMIQQSIATRMAAPEPGDLTPLMRQLIIIDGTLIAHMLDHPSLGPRAVNAFSRHCQQLCDMDAEAGHAVLAELRQNFARTPSESAHMGSSDGIPKVLTMIDERLRQNPPKSAPARPGRRDKAAGRKAAGAKKDHSPVQEPPVATGPR